ncbi:C-C chemokine receptor type 1-like [Melanotaenia boesemani]|uniref:C-C chemokine receptor type 1-like n=1 Tax=Melanotaenia boesemani TaxID=1250792 RepID=UPI001C05313F|nr:C-C chemokine receptor type 1-like [Melanotaenia boesemani]
MMETTTPTYDYGTGTFERVEPCNRDDDNNLGAQLSFIYYFMFVFSLLGNGLVLFIIQRFEKLTTVTNILLLNLVFSSLIFMSTLPFMAAYMQLETWIFGKTICKVYGCFHYLGFYSSVLLLTLLTFDRHLAVVYSLSTTRLRNRSYVVISCTVVWLVSGLACIRPMLLHNTFMYLGETHCDEFPGKLPNIDEEMVTNVGFYVQLLLFLIFPMVVIIYCYIRIVVTVILSKIATKFKTVRLIFIIVLMFFICWAPFNVVMLLYYEENIPCEEKQNLGYALQITRNMAYVYFSISPMFYTFVGKKFQNYFRHLLVKRFPSLRNYISVQQLSRTNLSTKTTPSA